ncbi:MAG: hypothetical protein VBE63_18325 [Lamprobacter sp.]|nr:hypothetical protein [Lamprobacter sp.]MEA3641872.1 hypothetical protein [Lamprobacter sp.]
MNYINRIKAMMTIAWFMHGRKNIRDYGAIVDAHFRAMIRKCRECGE